MAEFSSHTEFPHRDSLAVTADGVRSLVSPSADNFLHHPGFLNSGQSLSEPLVLEGQLAVVDPKQVELVAVELVDQDQEMEQQVQLILEVVVDPQVVVALILLVLVDLV